MITNSKDTSLKKRMGYFCGTSGSGKSHQMKDRIAKVDDRAAICIYDPEDEYCEEKGYQRFTDLREFNKALFSARHENAQFDAVYVGKSDPKIAPADFQAWCASMWSVRGAEYPTLSVVDELGALTKGHGKAAAHWFNILTRGRKYDMHVLAGAANPQDVDMTILRMKNELWVGYLEFGHKYISDRCPLTQEQVENLRPDPHFDSWLIHTGKEPVFHSATA